MSSRHNQRSQSSSKIEPEDGCRVQVMVRCRPPNAEEKEAGKNSVQCDPINNSISISKNTFQKTFAFDGVYSAHSSQEDLYHRAVAPIVEEVLKGFNCTVFAYGQTGCGKVCSCLSFFLYFFSLSIILTLFHLILCCNR